MRIVENPIWNFSKSILWKYKLPNPNLMDKTRSVDDALSKAIDKIQQRCVQIGVADEESNSILSEYIASVIRSIDSKANQAIVGTICWFNG